MLRRHAAGGPSGRLDRSPRRNRGPRVCLLLALERGEPQKPPHPAVDQTEAPGQLAGDGTDQLMRVRAPPGVFERPKNRNQEDAQPLASLAPATWPASLAAPGPPTATLPHFRT